MRISPFSAVYSEINKGTNKDKLVSVPDAPKIIDVELTNHCNFKCRMCPTGRGEVLRPRGYMSSDIFDMIVQYCAKHGTALRFIRWGEPMLHPRLFEFIRLAKSYNLLCHMNTNGSLMDDYAVTDIIKSKLDSIKFSFQGVTAYEYAEWRQSSNFIPLCGWIKHLYVRRGKRRHPYIQVGTTISNADEVAIKEFHQSMATICDEVTIGTTKDLSQTTNRTPVCPEAYDKLSIDWNGDVTACCRDYDNFLTLGNIKTESLHDIWNSEGLHNIRLQLANNNHALLPLCNRCIL